jgi:L-asparaginase II
MLLAGVPLVEVTRGGIVESLHAVAACACSPGGAAHPELELGAIDVPVYLRSAAKPFIAAAVVASGAVERFGLEAREIAVISASHNGEPEHVAAVRSILRKCGFTEADLRCGASPPNYEPEAAALAAEGIPYSAIHHNCSGKHAGILALARSIGADPATYLEPGNPAQVRILALCGRMCDEDPARFPLAVDGCGIPVYAITLRRAALSYARFATLENLSDEDASALARVRAALVAEPFYLAGTGRFDTGLVAATAGKIVGKTGAEGVHGDALVERGLGFALKVIDGNRRATPPATLALLRELDAVDARELAELQAFVRPPVRNAVGRVVGGLRAIVRSGAAADR